MAPRGRKEENMLPLSNLAIGQISDKISTLETAVATLQGQLSTMTTALSSLSNLSDISNIVSELQAIAAAQAPAASGFDPIKRYGGNASDWWYAGTAERAITGSVQVLMGVVAIADVQDNQSTVTVPFGTVFAAKPIVFYTCSIPPGESHPPVQSHWIEDTDVDFFSAGWEPDGNGAMWLNWLAVGPPPTA